MSELRGAAEGDVDVQSIKQHAGAENRQDFKPIVQCVEEGEGVRGERESSRQV